MTLTIGKNDNPANLADGESNLEETAAEDMKRCMSSVREALACNDCALAKHVYDYLITKAAPYADYGCDGYDIVTCSDFAYDAYLCLSGLASTSREQLMRQYEYLFDAASPNYRNSDVNDNVIHSTGAYTGPDA